MVHLVWMRLNRRPLANQQAAAKRLPSLRSRSNRHLLGRVKKPLEAMTKGVLGKLMILLLATQTKRALAVRRLAACPVRMTKNHLSQAWVGSTVTMLSLLEGNC